MAEAEQADDKQSGPPGNHLISVRIESDQKSYEVRLAAVNHLFTDISRYNDKFSLGSMMARQIFSTFEPKNEESQVIKSLRDEEEHQQMTASALAAIHKDTLAGIGLSLEPVSGKKATMIGPEGAAGEGEMRVNVANRNKFTSFLGALTPELVETTGIKPNLEDLSGILKAQVLDHYDLKKPTDEMLELFGGLGNIVDQYKRLKMAKTVEGLDLYLQHARQGDLREFVAIEKNGLFSEPGKFFGPADWQKDSASPQWLENRWNNALALLQTVKNNPNAQELYSKLQKHLLGCINIARTDKKSFSYYPENTGRELEKVLESVHMKLEEIILRN